MNKVVRTAAEALERAGLRNGSSIMMGGFGLCGIPENLIAATRELGVTDLTVMSNNAGVDDFGIGVLLATRQVSKMISTYVGENKMFERQFLDGSLEVELIPQGTFAEKLRAGGAGIGAFYTPTGYGTWVAEGGLPTKYDSAGQVIKASLPKETREIDGRLFVLEFPLKADFAFVKGYRGDAHGNVIYRKTTRNFSPMMATAAAISLAEVEKLEAVGALDPDAIHTPGIYVDWIFQGANYDKRIERRTNRPSGR
ncbi:MAG: CoA transferase subunit A [Candidatus Eisenbacteria bacterium]|nr:CoA transferase subunit A [Candidatus Eisenbacteria bacterium]